MKLGEEEGLIFKFGGGAIFYYWIEWCSLLLCQDHVRHQLYVHSCKIIYLLPIYLNSGVKKPVFLKKKKDCF